jgi:signal transduction histidine kinase
MAPKLSFAIRFASAFLLVGLAVLSGVVGLTFWLGERAQTYFSEVIEARDARIAAVELRSALQSSESSQRGYVLTGNEIYLSPYDTAKEIAQRQVRDLGAALPTYPQSKLLVERLADIVGNKIAEMDRSIALKRARQDAEAVQVIRSNRGKTLMDEANVYLTGIIAATDERLTNGITEQRANAARLRLFSVLGGIVIVAVVAAAVVSIARYTRELSRARDEVTTLNRQLEERVRERTLELSRANEEIRHFAHVVSHDLRAPLVNVMGFTAEIETASEELQRLSAEARQGDIPGAELAARFEAVANDLPEAVGFIRSSAQKMDGLIGAILRISREGRRELHPTKIDLAEVLETATNAVQHQLVSAGGTVSVSGSVPEIVSDRLSLDQIFGNLLDNAVKYRAAERPLRVAIRIAPDGRDHVVIEVADNGRGIAASDLHRIFDLFARVGTTDQRGDGVGLALVRTLAKNLGGDISATSELGEGTVFHLRLPLRLAGNSDLPV